MGSGAPNKKASHRPTCAPQNQNPHHTPYLTAMMSSARDPAASQGQSTTNGAAQTSGGAQMDGRGDEQARRQLQAMLEQASREALREYAQQAQHVQQGMSVPQIQNGGGYQTVQNGMMMDERGHWVHAGAGGYTAAPQYLQQGFDVPQNGGQPFVSNDGLITDIHGRLTKLGAGQHNGTQQSFQQQQPSQQGFGTPQKRPNAGGHQGVQKRKTPNNKRRRTQASAGGDTTTQQTMQPHHSPKQDFGVHQNGTEYQVAQNAGPPAPQSSYYQVPRQSPQQVPQGHAHRGHGLSQDGTGSHVVKSETTVNGQDQNTQSKEYVPLITLNDFCSLVLTCTRQDTTAPQTPVKGEIGNGKDTP